jgi:toxin-antitoxin system PIN domain toxin
VILIDANLLIYAHNSDAEKHERSRQWLRTVFQEPHSVRFSWDTIQAFLRITTHPRVFAAPFSITEAVSIVGDWLSYPGVAILEPGPRHWSILSRLMTEGQVRGPLVSDAHLAAMAIEHGATLCTTDRDFTRFPGVRLLNPLA